MVIYENTASDDLGGLLFCLGEGIVPGVFIDYKWEDIGDLLL